jgi:hypothetical protein
MHKLDVVLRRLVFLVGFAIVGCTSEPAKGTINGTVTFDGQPLKDGTVNFMPTDGKAQTASAAIIDGKFTASVPIHTMKVTFSAPKVVGKRKMYDTPDSPTVDDVEELLPAKYTTNSQLTVTVKGGIQMEKFDLTSK